MGVPDASAAGRKGWLEDPGAVARLQALFDHALDLSPDERASWLEALPDHDVSLRPRLLELLAHDEAASHATGGGSVWPPAVGVVATQPGFGPEASGPRLAPGALLGGCTIGPLLARSHGAEVYAASRADPRREVVVKVSLGGVLDEEARRRFSMEASLLARIRHPGIVSVLAYGQVEDGPAAGSLYLVMPRVQGRRLDVWVREESPGIERIVGVIVQACEAVHHANLRGVVHRDLKPSNILVEADDRVFVIDFGAAKLVPMPGVNDSLGQPSLGHAVVGTPAYMAPEQFAPSEQDVDLRADVYALGAVAYEAIAGRPPIDVSGMSLGRAALTKETATPLPLRRAADLGPWREVSDVVGIALVTDAADRYESCGEMGEDLRRAMASLPLRRRPPGALRRLALLVRRRRDLAALAACLVVSVLAGLGGTLWYAGRAIDERNIARARFEQAREIAAWVVEMPASELATVPSSTRLRGAMVDRAIGYLDALAAQIPADPGRWSQTERDVVFEIARARTTLGTLLGNPRGPNLGRQHESVAQLEEGRRLLEALAARWPAEPAYRVELGANRFSLLYASRHHSVPTVLAEFQQVVDILRSALADRPDDPRANLLISEALSLQRVVTGRNHGVDQAQIDSMSVARDHLARAEAALGAEHPDVLDAWAEYWKWDASLRQMRDPAEPLEQFQAAADILERLLLIWPHHPENRLRLATALSCSALVLAERGQIDQAIPLSDRAIAVGQQVVSQDEQDQFAFRRALTYLWNRGDCHRIHASRRALPPEEAARHWQAALDSYSRASDHFVTLLKRDWSNPVEQADYPARLDALIAECRSALGLE